MKLKLTPLCSIVLSTLALTACGGGGDDKKSDNKQVPTAPETMTVKLDMLEGRIAIPVQLVDAKTGEPIQQKVILTASDDVADANVYENANLGANADNSTGLSTIFLKADAVKTATKENPVKLRLIANSEGYFSSSIDINYDGTEAAVQRISLVKVTAPPDGIAVAEQKNVTAKSDGTLQVPIQLSAKTAANDPDHRGAGASFSLPAGTILKDRAGNPLTGDLKVTIGYFSPKVRNIAEVFPGGLSPAYVRIWENGQWNNEMGGTFISAGLMAVDIVDSQGRKAHLLEGQKATMTIQTPADLINADLGKPLKEGDIIPIWSHSEATGVWQREQMGVFKRNAEGNFEVSYEVNHLSYWNLDWKTNECSALPTQFSKPFSYPNGLKIEIRPSWYPAGTSPLVDEVYSDTTPTGLHNAPRYQVITYTAKDQSGKIVGTGTKAADGTCNSPVIQLNTDFVTQYGMDYCPNPVNITFSKPFETANWLSLNGYYFRDSTPITMRLIKNRIQTFEVKDNRGVVVGTATKPINSCDAIVINMNEDFIQQNTPIEYCSHPVKLRVSKPFLLRNLPFTATTTFKDNNGLQIIAAQRIPANTKVTEIEFAKTPKNREVEFGLFGGVGIKSNKPNNSCDDVTINTDMLPSGYRQVVVKPVIQLKAQLSYADVSFLINDMTLSEQVKKDILAYTHPRGVNSTNSFELNNITYKELMNKGLSKGQITALQILQAVQIQLESVRASYQFENLPLVQLGVNSKTSTTGEVTLELPNDIDLNNVQLGSLGFVNNLAVSDVISINIPANATSVNATFGSVRTIKSVVSSLKNQCRNGLPATDPNAKYCGFFK